MEIGDDMAIIDKDRIINNMEDGIDIKDYRIDFYEEIKNKVRIVFMGTPSFAVPILEGLIANYEVVLVVCQPDRNKDRKGKVIIPDTKRIALEHNIPVFQPFSVKDDYQTILDYEPDLIVTCAYGQFIPSAIIDYPKYGCINVHGSLLPKLRGGAPIHHAIINGDKVTGMTVMAMSKKMDAGDIISQRSLEIGEDEILDSLYQRMSILGMELLLDTIPNILNGTAKYFSQNEEEVTFGMNVTKEEEKIDFAKSAVQIKNLVRGLNSIPGAYCFMDDKRMKVYQVEIINNKYLDGELGEIVDVDNNGMIVRCNNGYLKVLDIAMEGKKRCLVKDYFNGIKKESLIGKVLR